jgi:RHS repeat-associated protein
MPRLVCTFCQIAPMNAALALADPTVRPANLNRRPALRLVTAYFGGVEVRNFGAGAAFEELHIYPYTDLRVTKTNADGGAVESQTSWLHRDGLSSVRGVTGPDGLMDERSVYRPFGEAVSVDADPTAKNESKGWIGERFDADAGLQYLNARYYDPKLGLFLQPDWWEVTEPGVGTNRYSYAFNDPIGASDPSGHIAVVDDAAAATAAALLVAAIAIGEVAGDVLNDGSLNQNGPLSGATSRLLNSAGSLFSGGGNATGVEISQNTDMLGNGFGNSINLEAGGHAGVTTGTTTTTPDSGTLARSNSTGTTTTSTTPITHGNSKTSPRQTELYFLFSVDPTRLGAIDKIGITSQGSGRYSQSFYEIEKVRYAMQWEFSSRYPAIVAENVALVGYYATFGTLPRLNKVFR